MNTTQHAFEKAGLGLAPFRFVGVECRVGPIRQANKDGTVTEIGSPGQPMGCCEYCGQGIKECCIIRDRTGKEFIVGNVCVGKTHDKGLVDATKAAVNKMRLKAKKVKDAERIERGQAALQDAGVVRRLDNMNHPRISGKTMHDYVTWMFRYAGTAGKIRACRIIEEAVK